MRHLFLFFLFLLPLSLLAGGPKRELRGIWVATVSNIDWPSPRNYNAFKQKEEFIDLLNSHQKRVSMPFLSKSEQRQMLFTRKGPNLGPPFYPAFKGKRLNPITIRSNS